MQLLGELLVGVLSLYLAFTNSLALSIEQLFSDDTQVAHVTEAPSTLPKIQSRLQGIPSILIENAAYQGAAVGDSHQVWPTTATEPIDALVNILCTFTTDSYIRTTTGTGFFIHPDGVVLTNAHVAQFLLLEQTTELGETDCIARAGNPAVPTYELSLLYLPPAWIQNHADLINVTDPSGTGERDYALLYVSSGLNNKPMPRVFPTLSPDLDPLTLSDRNANVSLAGYPAGNFAAEGPKVDLIPVLAETTISEIYTFTEDLADVVAVRGSAIGEHGSSGGPILNSTGNVIGLISTKGNDEADGQGSLRGISLDYVNRTILEETGFDLARNVGGDLPYRAKVYNDTLAPFLSSMLVQELGS